ncbi:hypothetical protein DAPPUDRAFT_251319 [Daphnia pulex]|uniref:Uncharacterized protein n=1 Tax=Daphnia pulex TaxID=6669 RepID=E9H058_DAPPU|nr:hypothetical protein DAPPUDRAFT_251319 [Daphnia pulex]|eukprot:EFX74939.1 hypothetical protein DAPPUDRAFT_251319 [Daphnia pulex]
MVKGHRKEVLCNSYTWQKVLSHSATLGGLPAGVVGSVARRGRQPAVPSSSPLPIYVMRCAEEKKSNGPAHPFVSTAATRGAQVSTTLEEEEEEEEENNNNKERLCSASYSTCRCMKANRFNSSVTLGEVKHSRTEPGSRTGEKFDHAAVCSSSSTMEENGDGTARRGEEEEEDEKIKQKIRNSRVYIITDFYVAAPLRSAPNIGSHYLPMLTTRRFVQGQASQRAFLIDTGEGIIHHCRLIRIPDQIAHQLSHSEANVMTTAALVLNTVVATADDANVSQILQILPSVECGRITEPENQLFYMAHRNGSECFPK